jgi:TPR repeat protein
MYRDGEGLPEDQGEAVKWFRLSAEDGDADAQSGLGEMYEEGRGVPQSYDEAAEWFIRSAKQRCPVGQYNLGRMYEGGTGVPQSDEAAEAWYEAAALKGHQDALKGFERMINKGKEKNRSTK